MKKFTCRSCRNEWYVDESLSGSVCTCPFCRAEIPRPLKPENIDTLGKAIYSAVSALDLDILSQAARMKGYLMDTVCDMPELKKEIRLFWGIWPRLPRSCPESNTIWWRTRLWIKAAPGR